MRFIIVGLLIFIPTLAQSQSKWMFGPEGGVNFSRYETGDSFSTVFSRKNKISFRLGLAGEYNLGKNSSIDFGLRYNGKGYRINMDTLRTKGEITQNIHAIELPIGISFRQSINGDGFITEKFGVVGSYTFGNKVETVLNDKTTTTFRILQTKTNQISPLFYLGIKIGGNTDSRNRYEFGVTYYQSVIRETKLDVQYGKNFATTLPLLFRGGYLNIGLAYFINGTNLKKDKSDYYID